MSIYSYDPDDSAESLDARIEAFCRAHTWEVIGRLIQMGFPDHIGHEAVNDGLTAVARTWQNGEHLDNPRAFLFRASINAARNALKKSCRKETPDSDLVDARCRLSERSGFEATMARTLLEDTVREALEDLPERQRQAVTLRWLGELTAEEAAGVMGITPSTVESNRLRGEKKLLEIMKTKGYTARRNNPQSGKGDNR